MAMAAPSTGAKNISLQAGGPRLGLRRLAGRRRAPAVAASIAAMPQDLQLDGGRPAEVTAKTVFAGVPSFVNGQAVLWEETLLQEATLSRIQVAFAGPAPVALDRGLALWIFVEDLAMPRARIRLADLARLGGQRPLNLRVRAGGVVRVVLVDANGVWETDEVQPPGTFGIEVRIDM
jgi:hypothetical protein